jgi:hypothetical protein
MAGTEQTAPRRRAQRERWIARSGFTRTVRPMLRSPLLAVLVLFTCAAGLRAADESLARFDRVVVTSAKTSIYIGSVTMSFAPATRQSGAYASDYTAKVFPYFFMSEHGKVVLDAPDDTLRRLARGETVDFTGHGTSSDGGDRRFEGKATPTDATGGKLKVHVFVSKRIDLAFNMTYRFEPVAPPAAPAPPAKSP